MDDATSAITRFSCARRKATASSFRGLSETIRGHGLFSSFYTDGGSHYFTTPTAGAKVDKTQPTQVGRALKQLRMEHVPSYSAQARGGSSASGTRCRSVCLRCGGRTRSRRWRGQSLAGGGLRRATQRPLRVAAAEEGTAFIPFLGELDNILCIEQERVAGLDNTVRYEGRCLQIPPNRNRHHCAKSTSRVLEYWNGAIARHGRARSPASIRTGPQTEGRRPRKSLSRKSASRPACGRRGQLRAKRPEPAHPAHR